jgi:hypothetical protein
MFDYGESSSEFIKELNDELNKLEKNNKDVSSVNDYIKENASDYIVTQTNKYEPNFHKTAKLFGRNCYVNIMEIKTNIGKNYSLQIFVKLDRNLVCFGTSISKLDSANPLKVLLQKINLLMTLSM